MIHTFKQSFISRYICICLAFLVFLGGCTQMDVKGSVDYENSNGIHSRSETGEIMLLEETKQTLIELSLEFLEQVPESDLIKITENAEFLQSTDFSQIETTLSDLGVIEYEFIISNLTSQKDNMVAFIEANSVENVDYLTNELTNLIIGTGGNSEPMVPDCEDQFMADINACYNTWLITQAAIGAAAFWSFGVGTIIAEAVSIFNYDKCARKANADRDACLNK